MVNGEEIRGEFSSADATTAGAITWYKPNGAAYVPASPERIVITDILPAIVSGAGTVKVFSDNDADGVVDAGETLAVLNNASGTIALATEVYAAQGKTVKVKAAAAGQVDIVFSGKITRT
jgi:hypothetical protein